MPAHRARDPLTRLNLRVPKSLYDDMVARAHVAGVTVSDMFRSYLQFESVKPLGLPVRRKRVVQAMERAQCADPVLLRNLAAIGSNLNQIARSVNTGATAGHPMQSIELLAVLVAIERQFVDLVASNTGPTNAH